MKKSKRKIDTRPLTKALAKVRRSIRGKRKGPKRVGKPRVRIVDINNLPDNFKESAYEVDRKPGESLELFRVQVADGPDGEHDVVQCLVQALADESPHQFGHVLGSVLQTHAKIFHRTFGGDYNSTCAQILEGLIHEIAAILRAAQQEAVDEAADEFVRAQEMATRRRAAVESFDAEHLPNRGKKVH